MNGLLGACPEWYDTITVARSLNIHPWDYAGLPHTRACVLWREWTFAAREVEAKVAEQRAAREAGKPLKGRR
jgi:hypothetical protein